MPRIYNPGHMAAARGVAHQRTKPMKKILAITLGAAAALYPMPETASAAPKKVLVVTMTAGFRHTEGIDASDKVLPRIEDQSGGAFVLDWCRQPPGMPAAPKKPRPLKPDADEAAKAKFKAEEESFQAEMQKYRALETEYRKRQTEALSPMKPENLAKYDAVIFDNTSGEMPLPDLEGFLNWIKGGKAFIGIHAATDTLRNYKAADGTKPYVDMIGAEFAGHGPQVSVDIINQDPDHAACKDVPKTWTVFDEIYRMNGFERKKVHGLLTLDKHPNDKTPGDYPIAWCKMYGKGRVFYTSLGHRADVWDEQTAPEYKRQNDPSVAKTYQKHLLGGILWALGLAKGDATP